MGMMLRRSSSGRHRTTGTPSSGSGGAGLVAVLEAESTNLVPGGNTTVTSASFTPGVSELLVVKATAGSSYAMPNAISGGGLTWTKQFGVGTPGTSAPAVIWTASPATNTAMTVSVVFANTSPNNVVHHGAFVVERYTGATLAGTPAIGTVNPDNTSPYQATLTSTVAGSIVSWIAADYNGVNGTVTYVGAPTQTYRYQEAVAGSLSFSTAYQTAASPGTQTFGLSDPGSQVVTLGGIELIPGTPVGTGGGGGSTTTPATIALDSSTPNVARKTYSTAAAVTSASFTPPVGAVQVALVNVGWGPSPTTQPSLTITDTSGGTWTQMGMLFGGAWQSAIVTSPVAGATARTVTATSSSALGKSMQLAVRVLTGAAAPVVGTGVWTSATSMTATVTTAAAGSMVLVAATSGDNLPVITADATTTSIDVWSDAQSGEDMAVGQASTLTATAGTAGYGWTQATNALAVALEVAPSTVTTGGGGGGSSAPLIATLVDTFDGGSLGAQWVPNGGGVSAGQLYVNVNSAGGAPNYAAVRSAQGYQWSGSSLTFQVPTMPAQAGVDTANAQFWVMDPAPANTVDRFGFEYVVAANRLDCIGQTGAGYAAVGATAPLTYSATSHQWMRLSHTGTSIVWATSPDGFTWTTQRTLTSPPTWTTKTNLLASFEGFRASGINGAVYIDNVNAAPSSAPTPPTSTLELGAQGWRDNTAAVQVGSGNLGAKFQRVEFTIDELAVATTVADYCNANNIRLQPLIGWANGTPAPDLTALGTWASTLGPGGTHWGGASPVAAVTKIELGNENSMFYKSGLPGDAGYQNLATVYGQRALAAAQAVNTANPAVKVLVELEGGDSNQSMWIDKVLTAGGSTLMSLMGGPTIHLYGPNWRTKLNLNWGFLAAWSLTKPYHVTETGISTDNGRTLSDNYGWPTNLTYAAAATDHQSVIEGMANQPTKIKQVSVYNDHDTASPGASTDREAYFGITTAPFGDKGAVTTYFRTAFAQYRG